MHRIDNTTAVSALPTPAAAGTPGYFTNGDPVGGIPATIVDDDWANAVQEEIATVIEAGGDALDKADNTQLNAAIDAKIVAAITNGFAISLAPNGYIKFPSWLGGLIVQWAAGAADGTVPIGGNLTQTITFPLTFPTNAFMAMPGYRHTSGARAYASQSTMTTSAVDVMLTNQGSSTGVGRAIIIAIGN